MTKTAEILNIDEKRMASVLRAAAEKLSGADDEVVLDLSSVRRVDSGTLRSLQEFAHIAEQKAVKVVLRSVTVDVYKVLKLVKLTGQFSFEN